MTSYFEAKKVYWNTDDLWKEITIKSTKSIQIRNALYKIQNNERKKYRIKFPGKSEYYRRFQTKLINGGIIIWRIK